MVMHYTGWIALAAIAVVLLEAVFIVAKRARPPKWGVAGYVAVIASWLIYVRAYVVQDYTLEPVYESSSPGLPLVYKIASSWATGGGSLVLFTAVLAIIALAHRLNYRRRGGLEPRLIVGYNVAIVVAYILAWLNGGYGRLELGAEAGLGLNPLLKSPWIYPHPLATFVGYAFIVMSALSLWAGHERAALNLAKAGWIGISLGMLIGGYWAYETLGWGGYWAWDPVETAELVPWLVLTAYFHARLLGKRLSYTSLMLSAGAVFLAIYVTRAGLSPLHGFATPRTAISVITIGALLVFFAEAIRRSRGIMEELSSITRSLFRLGLGLTFLSLLVMFVATFVGLFIPAVANLAGRSGVELVPQGDDAVRIYYPILYPALLVLLASIPLCTLAGRIGLNEYRALLIGLIATSAVLGYLTYQGRIVWAPRSSLATNMMISVALPFVASAIVSSLTALAMDIASRLGLRAGISLLHAAMAITILGVMLSGPFSYNTAYFTETRLKAGDELRVGDVTVRIAGYEYEMHGGLIDAYTPYRRSLIYQAASMALLLLGSGFDEALKNATRGMEYLQETGILPLVEKYGEQGIPVNGTLTLEGVNVTITDDSSGFEANYTGVSINVTSITIHPRLTSAAEGAAFMVSLSGDVSLYPINVGNDTELSPLTRITVSVPEPAILRFEGGKLVVEGFNVSFFSVGGGGHSFPTLHNGTLIGINVALNVEGVLDINGTSYETPLTIAREDVGMYVLFHQRAELKELWEILVRDGLLEYLSDPMFVRNLTEKIVPGFYDATISMEQVFASLGEVPIPRLIPEGARMKLTVEVIRGGETYTKTLEIRFEANGEIQGIKGLVPKPLIISVGAENVYIEVYPPYVTKYRWGAGAHELMIYYLSQLFKNATVEERLALAAVFAAANVYNPNNPRALAQMVHTEPARLTFYMFELYDMAYNFDPANSTIATQGITVRIKEIPYINVFWFGAVLMTVAEAYILGLSNARSARREEQVQS